MTGHNLQDSRLTREREGESARERESMHIHIYIYTQEVTVVEGTVSQLLMVSTCQQMTTLMATMLVNKFAHQTEEREETRRRGSRRAGGRSRKKGRERQRRERIGVDDVIFYIIFVRIKRSLCDIQECDMQNHYTCK